MDPDQLMGPIEQKWNFFEQNWIIKTVFDVWSKNILFDVYTFDEIECLLIQKLQISTVRENKGHIIWYLNE